MAVIKGSELSDWRVSEPLRPNRLWNLVSLGYI